MKLDLPELKIIHGNDGQIKVHCHYDKQIKKKKRTRSYSHFQTGFDQWPSKHENKTNSNLLKNATLKKRKTN